MVTPEQGSITFKGITGRNYGFSIYSSDVVAAPITFSAVGLAGANSSVSIIANEDMILSDIAVVTGQTVSTVWNVYINDLPVGLTITYTNILTTLANRIFPTFGVKKGQKLALFQA
jgi:hypothetical protein